MSRQAMRVDFEGVIEFDGARIEVINVDGNRIDRVRATPSSGVDES